MDHKRKLKGMLARIFSDAVAEENERDELKTYLASGVLTEGEIKDVFDDFVQTTWRITIADGVVSDREKQRLREIADVLPLRKSLLPEAWAAVLDESE
jgi:tellurite resistance protein